MTMSKIRVQGPYVIEFESGWLTVAMPTARTDTIGYRTATEADLLSAGYIHKGKTSGVSDAFHEALAELPQPVHKPPNWTMAKQIRELVAEKEAYRLQVEALHEDLERTRAEIKTWKTSGIPAAMHDDVVGKLRQARDNFKNAYQQVRDVASSNGWSYGSVEDFIRSQAERLKEALASVQRGQEVVAHHRQEVDDFRAERRKLKCSWCQGDPWAGENGFWSITEEGILLCEACTSDRARGMMITKQKWCSLAEKVARANARIKAQDDMHNHVVDQNRELRTELKMWEGWAEQTISIKKLPAQEVRTAITHEIRDRGVRISNLESMNSNLRARVEKYEKEAKDDTAKP